MLAKLPEGEQLRIFNEYKLFAREKRLLQF